MTRTGVKWTLSLVLVGTCLASTVYWTMGRAVEETISQVSRDQSQIWAEKLIKNVPEVSNIANGARPSDSALQYLKYFAESPGVDKFELYSKTGELKLESDKMGRLESTGSPLTEHNDQALTSALNKKPFVSLENEMEQGVTKTLTETYLPIEREGEVVGVASVYLDQTQLSENLRRKFATTAILIAGLTAFGFAVPAAMAFLQSRRRQKADDQIAYLASHDALTGLSNYKVAEEKIQSLLATVEKSGTFGALNFVDIDHLKDINERHGHSYGDEVMKAVATRIMSVLHEGEIASRYTGDEFIVVLANHASEVELRKAVHNLSSKLGEPYDIFGKTTQISLSIGTSLFPKDGIESKDLVAYADIAAYTTKMNGLKKQGYFEPSMKDNKRRHQEIEALLRENLAAKSFELHYQPLFDLRNRRIKSFEALLRMKDKNGKFISPGEFVPVAEETGLIDEIGTWVLGEACTQAKLWPSHVAVAVNLSAVQFTRKSVVRATQEALHASGLEPSRLLLEVTESILMCDVESVNEQLGSLKAEGVRLALDDFGTGYSSLSYMLKFSFDHLKIDRSFVQQLDEKDSKAKRLVQTIVALGHNMQMAVTAEGVETENQASILRQLMCDDVQGFHFSKPVPTTELPALLLKDFSAANPPQTAAEEILAAIGV